MTKEELSPEQLVAFEAAMKESRGNIKSIIVQHVLFNTLLMILNVVVCHNFMPDALFMVSFLTGILIFSSANKELRDEADRFTEESQKILNNKL